MRTRARLSPSCGASRGRCAVAKWPYNTATWLRLRAAHLALEPACIGCAASGRIAVANTVDHVVPISEGGHPFPGHDGLASYCASCHSAKTARGAEAGAIRSSKPRRGCDPDGTPLDSQHPWHRAKTQRNAQRDDGRSAVPLPPTRDRAVGPPVGRLEAQEKSLIADQTGPAVGNKNQLVANHSHLAVANDSQEGSGHG
jgi:5-methylcytosine-specific restriction protein A